MNITELNQQLFQCRKQYIDILYSDFDGDYNNFLTTITPVIKNIDEIEHQMSLISDVNWADIPKHSDVMTLKTFIDFVNENIFVDLDGYGYYSDGNKMTNLIVYPSDIKKSRTRNEFTHIVWFNI